MTAPISSRSTDGQATPPSEPLAFFVRRQLFWLVAGVIVVSGAALALILVYLRGEALRSGERLTESFAHIIAEQSNSTLQAIDQRLQLASSKLDQLKAAGELSEPRAREFLIEEIRELPFVHALSVTDAHGRILYTSQKGSAGLTIEDRAYFQFHRAGPSTAFHVGAPVRSRSTGAWLISASRPMPPTKGAFAGIIVAALEPGYFDNLWRKVDLGAGASIALFQRDGTLMMRSPFDEATMGRSFHDNPLFTVRIPASPDGSFQDASPIDGAVRMLAYRTLSENRDLLVVVGQSYALVLAPWRQLATLAVATWAFASLAIMILGGFLNNSWLQKMRTEEKARQAGERLALATDAASIGVWDWDLGSDQWSATPTYYTMLGYEPDRGIGSREQWLERVHPDDRLVATEKAQAALAGTDVAYQHEARMLHADGSFRWVSVIGRVLERDESGRPRRLLGVMTDITESKRVEEELRRSESFNLSILDSVNFEIAVLNREGVIIAVNEPWRRFALENPMEPGQLAPQGQVGEAYLSTPSAGRDPAPEQESTAGEGLRAVLEGRSRSFHLEYDCHSNLARRWFLMSVTPLRGSTGLGAVVAHVNITERKLADEGLRKSIQEQEALLKEVHHRVKNNLQVITSLLRLETSRTGEPSTRSVLKDMQGRIRSMALLHETLYRTGKFAHVDLADYLGKLAMQLFRAHNAEPNKVRLVLDLLPVRVEIDQAIPCGLIVNELLTNSLKHAFAEGRSGEVRVELGRQMDGQARLHVEDTGVGLRADFESIRLNSLGLQLVSDLSRQIGGQLKIGPGPGASFSITFPAVYFETEAIVRSTG